MSEATAAQKSHRPRELTFSVNGLRLTAKTWGDASGAPTLALHGWLDNANSFDRLAPLLPGLDLVVLDFAGHGFSSHRPAGVHYTSLLDVQDAIAVANDLGWERFNLIGHSMGAAVASEIVGLFPERIQRAVMIDGFVHHEGDAMDALAANRQAIEQMLDPEPKQLPVYPDLDAMIRRVTTATDQSWDAAATLVARGHRQVRGGYTWRTDRRIRFRTPQRLSNDQLDALMTRSTAPSLLIVAEQGDRWYRPGIEQRAKYHPALTVERLDGPHHIHLEPQAPRVAEMIRGFFNAAG
jgi:pimeloyl-ACP methyl ester carboxylesterase